MKRLLLWTLVGVGVVLLFGALGFRFWFLGYLKSDGFRKGLSAEVSRSIGVPGEFMAIQPASLESIYTDGFLGSNGAVFRRLQADQIRADVRFAFLSRSCTVEQLEVGRLRLSVQSGELPFAGDARQSGGSASPGKVTVQKVKVNDLEADWPGGEIKGMRLVATPVGNGLEWLLNAEGGRLSLGVGPDWRVENAEARHRVGTLHLIKSSLRLGEKGVAQVEGTIEAGRPPEYQATFSGIPAELYLPEDWRARLTGYASGRLNWKTANGRRVIEGKVNLNEGVLAAFPFLEQVATVTRTDAFRRMPLHKGSAEVRQTGDSLSVSALELESKGLMRVEGAFTVASGQIDGTVYVGVAPSTLQWIPGAQSRVFTVSRDGYLWTPVRLSGPAAHPSEDLTVRLAAAAVNESVDAVKQGVLENAKGVIDTVVPLVPRSLPLPFP